MPRDPSGTFTFNPSSVAPAVPDTVIDASDFNAAMEDIAAELTDSLSRSGKGGMDSPMLFDDGTEAAPGIAYADDAGTGFFRPAAGEIAISSGGTEVARFDANGLTPDSLPAPEYGTSASIDTSHTGDALETDITGATITGFTATGRRVLVQIQPDGGTTSSYISFQSPSLSASVFKLYRRLNGGAWTIVGAWTLGVALTADAMYCQFPAMIDNPPEGTIDYKMTYQNTLAAATSRVALVNLVAIDL